MFRYIIALAVMLCFLNPSSSIAGADSDRLDQLTRQVETLSGEVEQLRSSVDLLNSLRPTTSMLMPSIAERFHVMHYAGDAGDWALAGHELLGIEHLLDVVQRVDPENGALAEKFLSPQLERLDAAIDHGNGKAFTSVIEQTVQSCNGCHVAAGSPSMVVVLDAADSLSLRHPHLLRPSEKPGEHTHKH